MTDTQGAVLGLRVGGVRLSASADLVKEVARLPRLTRVPHAPASLAGIANLRGSAAPIVSLGRLLGQKDHTASEASRVLVLDLDMPVGLLVDEVLSLGQAGRVLTGLTIEDDEAVRQIDLVALLKAEFAQLARPRPSRAGAGEIQAQAAGPGEEQFGLATFDLAGQTYGLPLEKVLEAARTPAHLAALPDSGAADLGVIEFRGQVLPLVSLRVLLGFEPGTLAGTRVLIVRIGNARVGLVVDRLNAIRRVGASAVSAVPAALNRGGGEARISSIVRLGEGEALVSVLEPERLFSDEGVAHILAQGRAGEGEMSETAQSGSQGGESFLIFRLGEEEYGLPIGVVEEVLKLPEKPTRLPRAPAFVEGVISLRGRVIPLIDQGRRFEATSAHGAANRRVLVTRLDGLVAGFIVDSVSEILSLSRDQLSPAPQLPGAATRVFDRVAHQGEDGRVILLVDPAAMLEQAEAEMLKAMADKAGSPGP